MSFFKSDVSEGGGTVEVGGIGEGWGTIEVRGIGEGGKTD
jgi:hypothetical protein